jgi:hypothetical protein
VFTHGGSEVHEVDTFFNTPANSYAFLEETQQAAWDATKPTFAAILATAQVR